MLPIHLIAFGAQGYPTGEGLWRPVWRLRQTKGIPYKVSLGVGGGQKKKEICRKKR